jgi:hypothetical protein
VSCERVESAAVFAVAAVASASDAVASTSAGFELRFAGIYFWRSLLSIGSQNSRSRRTPHHIEEGVDRFILVEVIYRVSYIHDPDQITKLVRLEQLTL